MEVDAKMPIQPELGQRTVLVCTADPTASAVLREVLRADSICFKTLSDIDTASADITIDRPRMAILEPNPPCMNGMEMCQVIRSQAKDDRLPVLIVVDGEDQHAGATAGITDWLFKPFTAAYAPRVAVAGSVSIDKSG
jgi:DNA-binding response OmpR family regulator